MNMSPALKPISLIFSKFTYGKNKLYKTFHGAVYSFLYGLLEWVYSLGMRAAHKNHSNYNYTRFYDLRLRQLGSATILTVITESFKSIVPMSINVEAFYRHLENLNAATVDIMPSGSMYLVRNQEKCYLLL